jgi:hypothetical protein
MTQPEEFYCPDCGGTDITAEASCSWDNAEQKWGYYEVKDDGYDYCMDCEDQRKGAFRPITDVKTLAQIAIVKSERRTA